MLRRRPVMRMAATTAVVAGTATAVSGGVRRHQDAKAQQQQAQAETAQAPPAPAPPAPAAEAAAEDPYEQLEKLGKLHEQGILTDEEFATAKGKLLA